MRNERYKNYVSDSMEEYEELYAFLQTATLTHRGYISSRQSKYTGTQPRPWS